MRWYKSLQGQLNLVLEDSASEDEAIISSEEDDVAEEVDEKMSSMVVSERCDSPDFHGFESWAEETEYVKSLEGFRRDLAAFELDRDYYGMKPEEE